MRDTQTAHHAPHHADALPRTFLVGCPKSGTTWLQGVLEAHPQVCSRGESSFGLLLVSPIFELLKSYNDQQRAGESNTFSGEDALDIARTAIHTLQRKWVDQLPEPERIRVIADKTPEHALALDPLNAVFPAMKVIHIIRDGRDCIVSGWHHNIRKEEAAFRKRFPTMERYAYHFTKHNWVPYINRARQWGQTHPQRYLEVRYEHLLESAHAETARIYRFLGVDAGDALIDQIIERTSFRSLSGGRDPGQVNNASHFRKGVSGAWREELDDASVRTFEQLAGELMDTLGYERSRAMSA